MITTWSHGPADASMPEAMLVDTMEKGRRHPWWLARAALAVASLAKWNIIAPARIADVGCGWGTNLEALEKAGYAVTGLDISTSILTLIDNPRRRLVEVDLNQDFPPEARETHDACLVLDVIEHLDDDRGALKRIAGLLTPGGICVVSV